MLKLDTHMGNGLICCVQQCQAPSTYFFLYFSSFFPSLQLANIKNLHLQNCFNITSDGYGWRVCEHCSLSAVFYKVQFLMLVFFFPEMFHTEYEYDWLERETKMKILPTDCTH